MNFMKNKSSQRQFFKLNSFSHLRTGPPASASPSSPAHSDAASALSEHERSDADPLTAWRHFQRMRATIVATAAHSSSSSSLSSSLSSYPTPELDALTAVFAAYSAIAHAAAAAYRLYPIPNRAAESSSNRDSDADATRPADVAAAIAAAVCACGALVGGSAANGNASSDAPFVSLVFDTSSLAAVASAAISNDAASTRRALDVHAMLDATLEGPVSASSPSSSASTLRVTEPLALAWVATAALLLRLVASEARLARHLTPARATSVGAGAGVSAMASVRNALVLASACERIGADLFGFGDSGVAAEDGGEHHDYQEGASGDGMDAEGDSAHREKPRRRLPANRDEPSLVCPCLTAAQMLAAAQRVVGFVTL
jgi:hypothetical protein